MHAAEVQLDYGCHKKLGLPGRPPLPVWTMLLVYRTSNSSSQHSCSAQLQTCLQSDASMHAAWQVH